MKGRIAALAAVAVALSGCVSPLVQPAAPSFQPKLSHQGDTRALAEAAAQSFALRVKTADKPLVYVAPGPGDMAFAGVFRTDLEQALMARGYAISRTGVGAEILNFDVQPFLYGSDRHKYLVEYASFWTTAANVGWELSQTSRSVGTRFFEGGLIGPVIDFLDAMDQTTRAEVVVNLSVVDANRVYYLDSRTAYVHPADLPFYMTRLPKTAPQMMSTDPAGSPVVPLRVSGGYGQ